LKYTVTISLIGRYYSYTIITIIKKYILVYYILDMYKIFMVFLCYLCYNIEDVVYFEILQVNFYEF